MPNKDQRDVIEVMCRVAFLNPGAVQTGKVRPPLYVIRVWYELDIHALVIDHSKVVTRLEEGIRSVAGRIGLNSSNFIIICKGIVEAFPDINSVEVLDDRGNGLCYHHNWP